MTRKNEKVSGTKVYGPYKGSKQNGGRKTVVVYNSKSGKMGSKNAARYKKEKELGRKLSKKEHVDHKDNNHNNDSKGNLRALKHGKNTAKEKKSLKKDKSKKDQGEIF